MFILGIWVKQNVCTEVRGHIGGGTMTLKQVPARRDSE